MATAAVAQQGRRSSLRKYKALTDFSLLLKRAEGFVWDGARSGAPSDQRLSVEADPIGSEKHAILAQQDFQRSKDKRTRRHISTAQGQGGTQQQKRISWIFLQGHQTCDPSATLTCRRCAPV